MDFWSTLQDVVTLLAAALVLGVVFERLKQSAILGYLLAGTLLGPGALNLIHNSSALSPLADLGVALLLFTIGLEFSWNRLRQLGALAIRGGSLQVILTAGLAMIAARACGLGLRPALAIGAMIATSSTASVLRMLVERAEMDSVHGRMSLGILLLQDIAIVPLVLLVTTLGQPGPAGRVLLNLGQAAALAGLFAVGLYLVSNFLLPRLLHATATSRNRELPILLAIATCLAAAWAAHALDLSPALGAFGAGMLLAESPYATQLRADVGALKTLFVTLFFASIGTLTDLRWIAAHGLSVAGLVAAIVLGKTLVIWLVALRFKSTHRHALATGICLAQVGEFAFVLAQIAWSSNLIAGDTFRLMVSATVATLLLTPYLVTIAPEFSRRVERRLTGLNLASLETTIPPAVRDKLRGHVIVIGFGPAGQGVIEALAGSGIPVLLVELNPRTVALARQAGIQAEVGDATQEEILRHFEVTSARAVVVTVPDHRTAALMIRLVKGLVPHLPVIVRARYHAYAEELRAAGAHVLVDEEQEIGHRLGLEVMYCLKQHGHGLDKKGRSKA